MNARIFSGIGVLLLAIVPIAQAQNPVDRAIDRGVNYLKNSLRGNNLMQDGYDGGSFMLGGLALLEAGVPANDPVIKGIAAFVREKSIDQIKTYQVALSILFLDRLGEPKDVPIIQMLGVRLLAGQTNNGGWSYQTVSNVDANSQQQLRAVLLGEVNLRTNPPKIDPGEASKEDQRPELHKDVVAYAKMLANQQGGQQAPQLGGMGDDNSNTQFAIMGVWVARKHGVPTENAIARIDQRFRATQDRQTGAWSYTAGTIGTNSPAMTCAGLIGLAVGHGLATELKKLPNPPKGLANRPALAQDAAVRAGFNFLAAYLMGNPVAMGMGMGDGRGTNDLYMLWSLERVSVIYGLEKIGPVDWYAWGADRLLRTQQQDGSWSGTYAGVIDTSFAVLFLVRANVAKDLSASLRGKLGGAEMRSGAGPVDPTKMLPPIGGARDPGPAVKNPPMREPSLPAPSVQPRQPDTASGDASRLGKDLLTASGDQFTTILANLRDARGSGYTESLASAIDQLQGDAQKKARDALARRLTRMTPETLNAMLKSPNREIRRASALACAMKDDKSHIPELIPLLGDSEIIVSRAVKASLVSLSGQDFGPAADATPIQRAKAIADWRAWYKTKK